MSKRQGVFRAGTSGYHYDHWRGLFYPDDLSKKEWFPYYGDRFATVEINNTFYHLPPASVFENWGREAPKHFCYALKFSRYGSHLLRLKKPRGMIKRFLQRAARLKSLLGPILVQLPPNWKPDSERLSAFLRAAPKSNRWAVEFRDERWLCEEVFEILREHGAALCLHDRIANHPRVVTADWVYLRFHGNHYGRSYSHQFLTARSREIRDYPGAKLDVFAYFNNDREGHATSNAAMLKRYVTK